VGPGRIREVSHTPRRGRDSFLAYTAIASLFLQAVIYVFPDVCSRAALTAAYEHARGLTSPPDKR